MERFTLEQRDDAYSRSLSNSLKEKCIEQGMVYDPDHPELIICIGGDGTLLRAIHKYLNQIEEVYFVGIHTGTLGFLTDYTKDEIDTFIQDLKKGPIQIEEHPLLKVYSDELPYPLYAFNEIRLESFSRTLNLEIFIDNEFFETVTGSGILVCTQAGSTAMNRALQGAVIDSGLNVLQLCEIMPVSHHGHHSLRNPYIMNINRIITISGKSLHEARLGYDYLECGLKGVGHLSIRASEKKVRFSRYRTYSYFKRLKSLY